MANVKFTRKEVEKEIKLTPDNLDKIRLLGIPIELTGNDVEIEVLANRPDIISLQGFLRAIRAFTGKEVGLKKYKINKPENNYKVIVNPSVEHIRPYTVCSIVKSIKLNNENIKTLIDLQEKLHSTLGRNRKKIAIGIYPLDKISLPIKYEAMKPSDIKFQPLEAKEEMSALDILHRHTTGKDYAHLLEKLPKFPVFVDSKGKILSMPPIINSEETGRITQETTEMFIECSGLDLNMLKKTLNIITTTLADMGGKIYQMNVIYEKNTITTPDLTPDKMKISLENVNSWLGLTLKEKDLEKLLLKMGYDFQNKTAIIPAWRTDVSHEVDIIEDIAIAYGYDNLIPEISNITTVGEETKEEVIKSKISEILVGLGFLETLSYHLIKTEEAKQLNDEEKIEVENSKTEYKLLRPNLIIPNLRILSENKDHEYPHKIFEIGKTFQLSKSEKSETGIEEQDRLVILSTPSNFTELKKILDYLMRMLDSNYEIKESKQEYLIEGRTGSIIMNKKEIGFIGEVHPDTLKEWNLKMPLALIEINLQEIYNKLKN